MQDKVKLTISNTATGKGYYIQLMSEDQMSLNVVIVTKELEFRDRREKT